MSLVIGQLFIRTHDLYMTAKIIQVHFEHSSLLQAKFEMYRRRRNEKNFSNYS